MSPDIRPLVISVPDDSLAADLADDPGIDLVPWAMDDAAPRSSFDIVVPPYLRSARVLSRLTDVAVRLVQSQSIGFDGVARYLPPGNVLANAASVHEGSTAELAVGLAIASQRELPRYVRAQDAGQWAGPRMNEPASRSLADSTVLIVGFGGVGRAVAARLAGFEVKVEAIATRARVEQGVRVHTMAQLPQLLEAADIVILTLPGTDDTRGLVDEAFLAAMRDGALLINVGRGALVDTDALLRNLESGRIRAALDVVSPEPLPDGHPLWAAPGLVLTPHVGGASQAMRPRIARLVREQAHRMRSGEEPLNVVLRT